MKQEAEILIAEDDMADRLLLQEAFKLAGVNLSVAFLDNGDEVIDWLMQCKAKGHCPRLVLMDLNMPRKDGLEALEIIRADEVFNDMPVIIFTGSEAARDRSAAADYGANDFVVKPTRFDGMVEITRDLKAKWLCE